MDKQLYNKVMKEIEQLAQMTQREFVAVREEMGEFRKEVKNEFSLLRNDMEAGMQGLAGMIKDVHIDVKELKDASYTHEFRIDRLEKRAGVKASKNPR